MGKLTLITTGIYTDSRVHTIGVFGHAMEGPVGPPRQSGLLAIA
jgi:hypothetical protein